VAFAAHFLHHVKENSVFYSVLMKRKKNIERRNVFILFFLYKYEYYNPIHEKWI